MDRIHPPNRGRPGRVVVADGSGARGGTLVALPAGEGVLMIADTRTGRDAHVRSEAARKIAQVHPTAAMGSTGDLGAAQSFLRAVRSEADRYGTRRGEPMDVPALARSAATELRARAGSTGTFVLGGVDDDGTHVFTLDPEGGALEEEYVAVGTGREVAYGVLDAEELESLEMGEARRIAGRVLERVAERDPRTGRGVDVAEITSGGVDVRRYDSVDELP